MADLSTSLGSSAILTSPSVAPPVGGAGDPSNNDCYFFYYSSCVKGSRCPFRHEPSALASEVVCTFWKQGKCTKPNCIYRHMDIVKKRSTIPCFWEGQSGGCKKPHCPFLHEAPKEPYPEDMSLLMGLTPTPGQGPIIVNPTKMDQLAGLIWPVQPPAKPESSPPARSFWAGRVSVKDRLGHARAAGMRARLGAGALPVTERDPSPVGAGQVDPDPADHSEEEALRRGAIQTLDLRSRLAGSTIARIVRHVAVASDPESQDESPDDQPDPDPFVGKKVKSVIKKVKKEARVKKRLLKKKAKKLRKEEKRQKKRAGRRSPDSSAAVSDDGAPASDQVSDQASDQTATEKEPQRSSGTKRRRAHLEDEVSTHLTGPDPGPISRKRAKKRDDKAIYDPLTQRRLKAQPRSDPTTTSSVSSHARPRSQSASLEDAKLDAVANESIDVIKEIDDLLNNSD